MGQAQAFVLEADLEFQEGCDPPAVGAAVTVELCGHWEHGGACRWPHNNAIDESLTPARFRTLFVADAAERADLEHRIETSLRAAEGWRVLGIRRRPVAASQRAARRRSALSAPVRLIRGGCAPLEQSVEQTDHALEPVARAEFTEIRLAAAGSLRACWRCPGSRRRWS
jgi:hypothetical protein